MEAHPIENGTEWNDLLKSCPDFNVLSTFEWGEFKKRSWDVRRLAFVDDGEFVGGAQLLLRRKLGLTVGWLPGGIQLTDFSALAPALRRLSEDIGNGPFALRINLLQELTPEKKTVISQVSELVEARRHVWISSTVLIDFDHYADFLEPLSKSHRISYNKALGQALTFEESPVSCGDFVRLHDEMVAFKKLHRKTLRLEDVECAARILGDHLRMYSVRLAGELVSACLILRFGSRAYYYLAASNPKGRESFASFFLIVRMLDRLREEGMRQFDFGGIAPERENTRGITRFKTGFGGRTVPYAGEYDLSNNRLLCRVFNLAIGRKFRDQA